MASCERPVALSPTDSYAAWPRGKTPSSALRVGSSTVNVQPTALWPRPGRTVSSTHVPTGHVTASPVTHGPPSATRWVPRRCWRQRGDRRRAASAAPRGGRGRQAGSAHTLLKASQYVSSFVEKKQGSLVRNRFGRNTWRQESLCIYFINSNPSFPECWVNEPPSSLTLNPSQSVTRMLTELTVQVCVYAVPRACALGHFPAWGDRWEGVGLSGRTDGFRLRRE